MNMGKFSTSRATQFQRNNNILLQENQTITYKMRYNWYRSLGANWSSTTSDSDFSMSYPVIRDYTVYANSLDKFIEKYPYMIVETDGKAISMSTFGDVGKGKFGPLRFETINFNHSNYMNKYIVADHDSGFGYHVGAEIGIGLKYDGNKLILRPFTNGWIQSDGYAWRYLEFGLSVSSVTFYQDPCETNEIF